VQKRAQVWVRALVKIHRAQGRCRAGAVAVPDPAHNPLRMDPDSRERPCSQHHLPLMREVHGRAQTRSGTGSMWQLLWVPVRPRLCNQKTPRQASDPARCGSARSNSDVEEMGGRASAPACHRRRPVARQQSVVKREVKSVQLVVTHRLCTR